MADIDDDRLELLERRLAQDTTNALQSIVAAGRKTPDIVTSSLVSYQGKKPRRGVLELWLEIPPS